MDCSEGLVSLARLARRGVAYTAGLVLAGWILVPPGLAYAQQPVEASFAAMSQEQLQARQTELLAAMLRDPSNLDIAFEYATVSARLGDYEAAIGTFERMLIYAPGLPRIQLELGVLYYRLGSFDAARSYFEAALQAPDVPAAVEQRVKTFLAAIETAEEPAKFSASVVTGLRWQSNANAGPGGRQVTLNGVTFLLDDTAVGRPDWNAFVAGNIHAAYDLGTQGDLLEADLLFYGGRYFDSTRLNSELAEFTFGPSINMARFDIDNARLGVYGILSGVRLDDSNYSGAAGIGTRFAAQPDLRSALNAKLEYRYRWFRDSATYPTVSNRNGYQLLAQLTNTYQLSPNWLARVTLLGDYENAAARFEQSWELGAGIGAAYSFASPIEMLEAPWSIDTEVGYIRRQYDQPDPAVSATLAQRDNEFWIRSGLTVPIRSDFAVALSAEFRRLQSNYQTRDYSNTSVTLSVVKAF
jgi:tetratricopeptide (TPR) repeat protein